MIIPPVSEIQAAARVLLKNPVDGDDSFDETTIRLIGAYRELCSPRVKTGRVDDVWAAIVHGEWYAWVLATHEAAEVKALYAQGIDPFDVNQFNIASLSGSNVFGEAHLRATIVELQYLNRWAEQHGLETSEIAIEIENPLRGQFKPAHAPFVKRLQSRQNWSDPPEAHLRAASTFWQRLKEGLL